MFRSSIALHVRLITVVITSVANRHLALFGDAGNGLREWQIGR